MTRRFVVFRPNSGVLRERRGRSRGANDPIHMDFFVSTHPGTSDAVSRNVTTAVLGEHGSYQEGLIRSADRMPDEVTLESVRMVRSQSGEMV